MQRISEDQVRRAIQDIEGIMRKLFAVAVCATLLTACASTGNVALKKENSASIASKINKGATTQAQVREMLGSPTSVNFTDSGNEIWRYDYAKASVMGRNFIPFVSMFSAGTNVSKKQLVIFFNKEGVVQNYSMEESQNEVKQGIIPQ